MTQKTPPRYVPTLTQVVPAAMHPLAAIADAASVARTPDVTQPSVDQIAQQLRQQMLVRARLYIDIELQSRIRETISLLALEAAHKLFEELQPQLEASITQVIDEAIAQAIADAATHTP